MAEFVPTEHACPAEQRRRQTRGQWRVCAWCGDQFEGEAIDVNLCSYECSRERLDHHAFLEDFYLDYNWEDY